MTSFSDNPTIPAMVLYISQNDLRERYKKRTNRIRSYCNSVKTFGSITHLQTEVDELPDGTIRIKLVEVYPPVYESLMKAKQLFIEAFCEAQHRTKYIQAEGNHPLSERALKIHNLQTSYEFHEFRCPKCFKWWWKHVPKHKPVCKCYDCWLCLNPLKLEEQFGIGRFTCSCRNIFYCKCQASDSRKCNVCGCRVSKPYIRPYFRTDDAKRIPVTPEQQYHYNPNYAATNHGYYNYYFPHTGPIVNDTSYDMPQPSRRNTFGDFILPQIFAQNSQQFAARNSANPATMCPPPHATRGFPPLYPLGATSLQISNTNIRPALCTANDHTATLAIQPPTVISHPLPYSPQGGPQLPQSPVSASPAPASCSTTPAQTTMAVSLRSVPPVLDYTPLKDQVIPSSGVSPQSVNECNRSPEIPTTTSIALPVASGSASVLGEATTIPSSPISLPPATENSLQCNPQPPSMTPTTSGPLPDFPTAISSDPDPLRSDLSLHSQPQLNSSSASEKFPTPLSDALADLHITGTPCAPQGHIPETGSTPIQSQGLLQSDGPAMATLISPAPPGGTGTNPPLPSTATTQSTPSESDASTGPLVKVSGHVSSEKPPPDHHSGNVNYNPSVTTAIPPSYDPMSLSEPQRDLAAPNHHESSQAGDDMSLAAATKSDILSLPETIAPTISTAESSNTVTTSAALVDANTQTEVKMSMLDSTLSPSQGLATGAAPPAPSSSSSEIPQPPKEATTTSTTPQAIATQFESKAVQTAALPSVNVVNNNNIVFAVGNPPVVGSMAKPAQHHVRNDQWTSYYDNRVRIPKNYRMNPRDLKYKQVSTLHDCSGSTEYSTDFSAGPQLGDRRWKHHQMPHHPANRNQHYYESNHIIHMDYDMLEISSDEED